MKKILSIFIVELVLISCSRVTPSGFWMKYKTDFITEKQNDQGPWGGTLTINWVANEGPEFNIKEISKLASQNDWKLIDSVKYQKVDLKNMTDVGNPVINLPLKNFKPDRKRADLKSESFPRWIETDFKLYRFQTGWLIYEPGTDDSTQENGFVLLSSDNKKMTVYHLWGE